MIDQKPALQGDAIPLRAPLHIGATVKPDGVHFRVWAPNAARVAVALEADAEGVEIAPPYFFDLEPESDGYHAGFVAEAAAGCLYRYRLDRRDTLFADPASRSQPEGPHGPSRIVDPATFTWTDDGWQGVADDAHVLYEMHIGTFTGPGTWKAAARELPELKRLGVTTIEMLPIAEFPGRFGWGYDGVNLYAPSRLYGTPDDLRDFVNTAHAEGLAVILDVVYNHLGPDGNYLTEFSKDYLSTNHVTEWGDALNFDGDNSQPVRDFFRANAVYWMKEFHFDGMRLDATQNIYDDTDNHIVAEIVADIRAAGAPRPVFIVAENEPQNTALVRPHAQGGYDATALANDDFHHAAIVAMAGRKEAYYSDYLGMPQEFISLAKYGYLYQGQRYDWQKNRRGRPSLDVLPHRFVNFLENHDQIANSGRGYRAYSQTSPGRARAMTALLLLSPQTPMLFQGQEFGSSRPFYYFADHHRELAAMVGRGRAEFLAQFPSLATEEMRVLLPDPGDPETFVNSKLDLNERYLHAKIYDLHRDLLALRRQDSTFNDKQRRIDGAVLGPEAFVLRYFGTDGDDRLLIVNMGRDLHYSPSPEPLLAPVWGKIWQIVWSSEDPHYGGCGTAEPDGDDNWRIPGHATLYLKPADKPAPAEEQKDEPHD